MGVSVARQVPACLQEVERERVLLLLLCRLIAIVARAHYLKKFIH